MLEKLLQTLLLLNTQNDIIRLTEWYSCYYELEYVTFHCSASNALFAADGKQQVI